MTFLSDRVNLIFIHNEIGQCLSATEPIGRHFQNWDHASVTREDFITHSLAKQLSKIESRLRGQEDWQLITGIDIKIRRLRQSKATISANQPF